MDGTSLVGITQDKAAEIMMHTGESNSKFVLDSGHKYTGLGISFQTLEMSCLWWTGWSQIFFEEILNEKKYHAHNIWKFEWN